MTIRPVAAELFHADRLRDGRADMTKLKVIFRNFANARKYDEIFALKQVSFEETKVCSFMPEIPSFLVLSNIISD